MHTKITKREQGALVNHKMCCSSRGVPSTAKSRELSMSSDHNFNIRPMRGPCAKREIRDTSTSAASPSDNNWRWARCLESDERVAEAKIRKEEALAIKALEQDR